jgi:hypothetical protein
MQQTSRRPTLLPAFVTMQEEEGEEGERKKEN